jgi:hypothetical protein
MEFWLAPVTEFPVVIVKLAAEAKSKVVRKVMATRLTRLTWGKVAQQSVAERSAEANRPAQVKQGLLMAEAPAWRWDQPALAFAAPVWQWSIPSRDRLGCEQRLCSCQSNRKLRAPL